MISDILEMELGELLIEAAKQDRIEDVEFLVKSPIDVDETIKLINGETALMIASVYGHVGIVKVLIDAGADVNAVDEKGWTALIFAAADGNTDVVAALVKAGADMNARVYEDDWTALTFAVAEGNIGVMKVLIEKGADISVVDDDGRTILDIASEYNERPEMKRALLPYFGSVWGGY